MEDERSVRPENADERRGEKGESERLGIVKMFPAVPDDPLQENAVRAGPEIVLVADEIAGGVLQVAVIGQALGHRIIDGLVADQEPLVELGQVGEHGETEKKSGQKKDGRPDRRPVL